MVIGSGFIMASLMNSCCLKKTIPKYPAKICSKGELGRHYCSHLTPISFINFPKDPVSFANVTHGERIYAGVWLCKQRVKPNQGVAFTGGNHRPGGGGSSQPLFPHHKSVGSSRPEDL